MARPGACVLCEGPAEVETADNGVGTLAAVVVALGQVVLYLRDRVWPSLSLLSPVLWLSMP